MELPEVIKKIVESRKNEETIDECRISVVEGRLHVTHQIEVGTTLAAIIKEARNEALKSIQEKIPAVVNFGLLPARQLPPGTNKNVTCSSLTLAVSMTHNTTEEICELSAFAEKIHCIMLDHLSASARLENINKDLKPFYDE